MKERAIEAGREVMRACIGAGGTLTGEHGIGVEKQMYMHRAFSERDMAATKRLRAAFCPDAGFNPGKIFPDEAQPHRGQNYISPCPKPIGSMSSARMERQIRISPGENDEQL
jgi:hypothetical protein